MNWIKANTFLAVFIAVMVIGIGVLGFLLFTAKAQHDEVAEQYQTQSSELNRLLGMTPYPDAKNLAAVSEQKKEHLEAIAILQKNLAATEVPIEPLSPQQFQDRLRETVSRVVSRAGNRTKLPDKFYMGFNPYQTEPPKPEAAPILGRDLRAIEVVINHLLDNRALSINRLERAPIPEEGVEATDRNERGDRGGARNERSTTQPLAVKHPFELEFTSPHSSFNSILNQIVSSRTQFFIPRMVQVRNQSEQGPAREIGGATAAASSSDGEEPPPEGTPAAPAPAAAAGTAAPAAGARAAAPTAPAEDRKYIVGEENVEVAMLIEIVDFADPAAATAAK